MPDHHINTEEEIAFRANFEEATLDDIRAVLQMMNIHVVISKSTTNNSQWLDKLSRLERKGILTVV